MQPIQLLVAKTLLGLETQGLRREEPLECPVKRRSMEERALTQASPIFPHRKFNICYELIVYIELCTKFKIKAQR